VVIIAFFGGLALFLYGITMMSDYLKKATGSKFKNIIQKAVNTPIKGILIGTLVTAVTNSSSGVVVLVIGMVRAGLMTSAQSAGIIMGANIGTTITAFIVSLEIGEYAYAIVFIGVLGLFFKNKKIANTCGIITGFGILFVGLNLMGDKMKELISIYPTQTNSLFKTFSKDTFFGNISGFLFGTGFTSIIQSSSVTTAIIQKLYNLNTPGAEIISLKATLALILGANLRTTITGLLATIGGNAESKKTALFHVFFNLFGVIAFMIGLHQYYLLMQFIEDKFLSPYSMVTIAHAHLIQNVVSTVVLVFFINHLVKLCEVIVKEEKKEKVELNFDEKLIEQSPAMALELVKKSIYQLFLIANEYFGKTKEFSFKKNNSYIEEANTYEMIIDELDYKIHNYLIKIIRQDVLISETEDLSKFLDITKNLERIGDHLTNITEFFEIRYESNHNLSDEGKDDLISLYDLLEKMFKEIEKSLKLDYSYMPKEVLKIEVKLDELEKESRFKYLSRLKKGEFDFFQTSNFTDILSDLERIGDHLNNIASVIIDPMQENIIYTGIKSEH